MSAIGHLSLEELCIIGLQLAAVLTLLVTIMYVAADHDGRKYWRRVMAGRVAAGPATAFRDPLSVPTYHRQAPAAIRAAAAFSLWLGALFAVAGLAVVPLALFGLDAHTLLVQGGCWATVLGVPAFLVGMRLFGTGLDLLYHSDGAGQRGRTTAVWAKITHAFLLVVAGVAAGVFTVADVWHQLGGYWLIGSALIAAALVQAHALDHVIRHHRTLLDAPRDF